LVVEAGSGEPVNTLLQVCADYESAFEAVITHFGCPCHN
jgi:hypothetical protein